MPPSFNHAPVMWIDFLRAEAQLAAIWRKRATKNVHQRRFAGAIVSSKPQALTRAYRQTDVAQGLNRTKRLAGLADRKQRR